MKTTICPFSASILTLATVCYAAALEALIARSSGSANGGAR